MPDFTVKPSISTAAIFLVPTTLAYSVVDLRYNIFGHDFVYYGVTMETSLNYRNMYRWNR